MFLSEANEGFELYIRGLVLILVLLDVPFGEWTNKRKLRINTVLILVLLDVPFGEWTNKRKLRINTVLILVLLDVPFGGTIIAAHFQESLSLNPCFAGCSFRRKS